MRRRPPRHNVHPPARAAGRPAACPFIPFERHPVGRYTRKRRGAERYSPFPAVGRQRRPPPRRPHRLSEISRAARAAIRGLVIDGAARGGDPYRCADRRRDRPQRTQRARRRAWALPLCSPWPLGPPLRARRALSAQRSLHGRGQSRAGWPFRNPGRRIRGVASLCIRRGAARNRARRDSGLPRRPPAGHNAARPRRERHPRLSHGRAARRKVAPGNFQPARREQPSTQAAVYAARNAGARPAPPLRRNALASRRDALGAPRPRTKG